MQRHVDLYRYSGSGETVHLPLVSHLSEAVLDNKAVEICPVIWRIVTHVCTLQYRLPQCHMLEKIVLCTIKR